jgi:Lon protease-like protein
MKPKYPLTQPFEKLPEEIPIYSLENALLPGGELPLALSEADDLAMFFDALRTDQLIGMIQPKGSNPGSDIYNIGCAGRIRQYRERKDGKINVMITGVCRYKVVEVLPLKNGFRKVIADWSDFPQDYETEEVQSSKIDTFKANLRDYFQRQQMQIDWDALNKLHIEDVVNNLVLVMNFGKSDKQLLLESPTINDRLNLFIDLLKEKPDPIWTGDYVGESIN